MREKTSFSSTRETLCTLDGAGVLGWCRIPVHGTMTGRGRWVDPVQGMVVRTTTTASAPYAGFLAASTRPQIDEEQFQAVLAARTTGADWVLTVLYRAIQPPLLAYLRAREPSMAEDLASAIPARPATLATPATPLTPAMGHRWPIGPRPGGAWTARRQALNPPRRGG